MNLKHTCHFSHEHAHDNGGCLACDIEQEREAREQEYAREYADNEDSLVTVEFDRTVSEDEQELIDEIDSFFDEHGDYIGY